MKKRFNGFLWAALFAFSTATIAAEKVEKIDFAYPDLDGKIVQLADFKGQWVVVNFWATWCPPCLWEMPDLDMLNDSRDDIVVLGVNSQKLSDAELKTFMEDLDVSFKVLRVKPRARTIFGPVRALPTTFLVDPEGYLVAAKEGLIKSESIEAFIEKYIPQGERK